MSSTRRANPSAPLSQERYMSSQEYVELRGISGPAVTIKAELMAHPAKRSLLFFLQAMSLKPGGLKQFTRDFLEMFKDRIGTPTMHEQGMEPGKIYDAETSRHINFELYGARIAIRDSGESIPESADHFLKLCGRGLSNLDGFIIELCINPKLFFTAPGETEAETRLEKVIVNERFQELPDPDWHRNLPTYESASLPFFKDIIGALFEYKTSYARAVKMDFVTTSIGRKVIDTLDVNLSDIDKKMVVVEGESGIGKTAATEAWCEQHLGEARYITMSGINHKTGFFRAIAKALGIGSSFARSSTEMQTRIEDVLSRSQLILVIDEGHHLFAPSERVYSRPAMIDWINTALYNQRIPVALVVTPQFAVRMARVEAQTTWNADQLRRRVKRYTPLPKKPTLADLEAVARKRLPTGCNATIKNIVGYALSAKMPMPAIVDVIDEARLLAQREGRERITFEDVDCAMKEFCAPSYQAMSRSFEAPNRRGRKPARVIAEDARPMEEQPARTPSTGRKVNLTGLSPSARSTAPDLVPNEA